MNVKERFLKYVSFPTMSKGGTNQTPSTEKQFELGRYLVAELESIGMENVYIDEHCYVYGFLKSNIEKPVPSIGFIAHMDTSSAVSDYPVKPRELLYGGGDIVLNEEAGIVLSESEFPHIAKYAGQRLIVTDGTTLLGADDKAGIAEIVSAMEDIMLEKLPHGNLSVCFTPDEEIGHGASLLDLKAFGADYAYTLDGSEVGEVEYENFNASGAHVTIKGRAIHPGSAKDAMINAAMIACEFDRLLPADEVPEKTEGYEGFHMLSSVRGETERAELSYIIRDHDLAKCERKKQDFLDAAALLNKKYGEGVVSVALHDSYFNMRAIIEKHMYIIERMRSAMRAEGVEPFDSPVRGGTDGARLSYRGLPCPNIGTGGSNFHSRFEFASVDAMEKTARIVVRAATDI